MGAVLSVVVVVVVLAFVLYLAYWAFGGAASARGLDQSNPDASAEQWYSRFGRRRRR
jgi:hypothetical protein